MLSMKNTNQSVQDLIRQLTTLHDDMLQLADQPLIDAVVPLPTYRLSAQNLLHYLALRQHDLRSVQSQLASLGLSSLGRAESHPLATVETVLKRLHQMVGSTFTAQQPAKPDFATGQRLLLEHTRKLLKLRSDGRSCRIMVTMGTEAADDPTLIHSLLEQGMDCMRINCAHDNPTVWKRMIDHLRKAEKAIGRSCVVSMDLAGPKLRTGPLKPGPAVVKVKPQRNELGEVVVPARIWLTSRQSALPISAEHHFVLPSTWLKRLDVGDKLTFRDARDSHRRLLVTDVTTEGCWVELARTAYFRMGTTLKRKKHKAAIRTLPTSMEASIRLKTDDLLLLTRNPEPGEAAQLDHRGEVIRPARIGCTLPEALQSVEVGHRIWFNDGQIEAEVQAIDPQQLYLRIRQAKPKGSKLSADKGINLPDSKVDLPSLTDDDMQYLPFVVKHADVVALSFVNHAKDVAELFTQIRRLGKRQPAIILKIETKQGFGQLPNLLLKLMEWPVGGVMVARGDLAVECGFDRLAEVQEEIMWLCEAAHMPAIWATQVLEGLAKTGLPTRAEISDAVMGHRAECIMLNKGPNIVQTVQMLDNILRRMEAHQDKKSDLLRELHVAHALTN